MKTLLSFFSIFLIVVPAGAQNAVAPAGQATNNTDASTSLKEKWHITTNYETLPCLSIQQTQALKAAREDGVDSLVKEADIFHEKTKEFFTKNKKFICPPVLENPPGANKHINIVVGEANAFEIIYIVYPWQMEVQSGKSKDEIWKVRFDTESGVGFGKTKKLKNEFTLVPLMPRESDKSPYLIHSMKIPGHEKELIRICYPAARKKACNPYRAPDENLSEKMAETTGDKSPAE